MIAGFVRPFHQFEAWTCENIPKTGFFPFARIVETVEVNVPDKKARGQPFRSGQGVRLDHGVRGALDPALNAERAQQVAHKRGLACAEVAFQFNQRIADGRLARQPLRKGEGCGFVLPDNIFYNR